MKNWTEKRRMEELLDKVRELETDNKELKEQNAKFKREKQEVLGSLFGEDFVCGNGAKHHGKDYDNMCLYCEIESLRLRSMPDYGKPGGVPEFNGYYGFKDRPRGLTQYVSLGNSAHGGGRSFTTIIDGRTMDIDEILVECPTCCFTKRPIPQPREKE